MEIVPTCRPESWQSRQGARRRKVLHRARILQCFSSLRAFFFSSRSRSLRALFSGHFVLLTSRTRIILQRFSPARPPRAPQPRCHLRARQSSRAGAAAGEDRMCWKLPSPFLTGPRTAAVNNTKGGGAGESPEGGPDAASLAACRRWERGGPRYSLSGGWLPRGDNGSLHDSFFPPAEPPQAPHSADPRGWRLLPAALTISL